MQATRFLQNAFLGLRRSVQPSRNRDDWKNLAVVRTTAPLAEIMKKVPKNFYAIGKFIIKRIVDFNQGIDARLINNQNMAKLAEINISPLRIAFDHWEQKDIYEKAIRTAVAHGITNLSNYMLYNFRDKPEHFAYVW